MKLKIITSLLIIISVSSCSTKKNFIDGTYYKTEDVFNEAIQFKRNGEFSILSKKGEQIDTISVGTYFIDENYINLTSISKQEEFDVILEESYNPESSDITIEIQSNFIDDVKMDSICNVLSYKAFVDGINAKYHFSKNNIIVIDRIKTGKIKEFYVGIDLKLYDLLDSRIQSSIVSKSIFPNENYNNFKVTISDFNKSQLKKIYFKNEFIKLIDDKSIQWGDDKLEKIVNQWNE